MKTEKDEKTSPAVFIFRFAKELVLETIFKT